MAHRGRRAWLAVAVLAVALAASSTGPKPFQYDDVIERAAATTKYPDEFRGPLRHCVESWRWRAPMRSELFAELAERDVWSHRDVILLEIGGSTWANYKFVVAVDGEIQTDLLPNKHGSSAGRVRAPELGTLADLMIYGDDWPCLFLTVVKDGELKQVVSNNFRDSVGATADTIRELTPHLNEPPLPDREKR
jgi:hypothetical protein